MLQREGTRGALEVLEHVAGGVRVEDDAEQNPYTAQVLDEFRDGPERERWHQANETNRLARARRRDSLHTLEPRAKKHLPVRRR